MSYVCISISIAKAVCCFYANCDSCYIALQFSRFISFPFVSELFKFPLSSSSSALSVSLWFFYHSGVTGFDITTI